MKYYLCYYYHWRWVVKEVSRTTYWRRRNNYGCKFQEVYRNGRKWTAVVFACKNDRCKKINDVDCYISYLPFTSRLYCFPSQKEVQDAVDFYQNVYLPRIMEGGVNYDP